MLDDITRRLFFKRGAVAGLGAWAAGLVPGRLSAAVRLQADGPIIVTSHTNDTGRRAMEAAWELLSAGGTATDAVERAANIIEEDPDDASVGYGGLPNEHGVIQLDASFMDGKTYNAGAVASLENIIHPSSVARLVMERTDHVLLVGPAALDFARSFGFEEQDLMTERTREIFLRWREEHSDRDDWGPPDHLRGEEEVGAAGNLDDAPFTYGTVNVLAVDANGDVSGITTTSGLSWKINGRVGDSPIIGAGLYVDNDVGAAGATGRGEDVIKSCATYYIVGRMREGRSPQQACEDALRMIADRYRAVNIDYMPGEKFVAVNRAGEVGCAWSYSRGDRRPTMTVMRGTPEIYEGRGM